MKVSAEKFTVEQRVNRQKHKWALTDTTKVTQLLMGQSSSRHSQFYEEQRFSIADIPLSKLNNILKEFFEKRMRKSLLDASTLQKKIWVSMDETNVSLGRHVTNVVVRSMVED